MTEVSLKNVFHVLFEIDMSLDKDTLTQLIIELTNIQVMPYGNFGHNWYVNMTSPLAGQTYMEMLNKPL